MIDMKLCNYLIGVLGLLLGLFMMHSASAFPLSMTETGPGAGVWPFALGVVLALAGLILLGHTFWNRKSLAVRLVVINTPANLRVYIVMGLAVLFCLVIELLGFYLAALLMIPAVMLVLGCRSLLRIALTAVLTVGFIYLIFDILLSTKLPQSMFLG